MSTIKKIKDLVAATESDAVAFHQKGNIIAKTRLRKAYQQSLVKSGRAEVITVFQTHRVHEGATYLL